VSFWSRLFGGKDQLHRWKNTELGLYFKPRPDDQVWKVITEHRAEKIQEAFLKIYDQTKLEQYQDTNSLPQEVLDVICRVANEVGEPIDMNPIFVILPTHQYVDADPLMRQMYRTLWIGYMMNRPPFAPPPESYMQYIKSRYFRGIDPGAVDASIPAPSEGVARWMKDNGVTFENPLPWMLRLSDGKADGVFHSFFWLTYLQAQDKYNFLKERFLPGLTRAEAALSNEVREQLSERISIPGVTIPLTRSSLVAIACNGGNRFAFRKLVEGEGVRPNGSGLTEGQLQFAVSILSEPEKDWVQRIHDALQGLWPEIEKVHSWATGLTPEPIQAEQMFKAMDRRAGGFYPTILDPDYAKSDEPDYKGVTAVLLKGWIRGTDDVPQRHPRKPPTPVEFSIQRLASHVDAMIRDLAFRQWLFDANKLLRDGKLSKTMMEHLGPESLEFLAEWVRRAARGQIKRT